ncbi:hypothetical protein [Frateuria soli]|uniref:hypothetical protein n=1 Tax=Frateuria soli TaxID=1542730 RepID=UPI001E3699C9|nr:hypothetical protein [Frateuria soli]UGB38453.1 hypothetical protein LQ771_00915 [Frateuria soli]
MKYLVFLSAWAMPVVAWLSNAGVFGPTNGEISDRYPTLIVAAGYAFAIWGPIFALDVLFGTWQAFDRARDRRLASIRPWTTLGFAMTSLWMVVFSLQWFWLALAIIWVSLASLLFSAARVSDTAAHGHGRWWQWVPLSLHAGWVSLAVFLNVAQVIVAYRLLPVAHMLPWSLVLFVLVAALLLGSVLYLRGNPWYALAAVWGLIGVYARQHRSALDGAGVAASTALGLAVVIVLAALYARSRRARGG